MLEIRGRVGLTEGASGVLAIQGRTIGPRDRIAAYVTLAAILAGLGALGFFGEAVGRQFWGPTAGERTAMMWIWALACIVGLFIWRRFTLLAVWRARGVPDPMPVTYAIADDALVITTPLNETRLFWPQIFEIWPHRGLWIVAPTGGAGHMLPARMFPERREEAAFIAGCLERMTPEARARSGEAGYFAGV